MRESCANTRPPDSVILLGPTLVGKTTVGQLLAQAYGKDFWDTDAAFTACNGPIADFFAQRGERCFRRLEAQTVQRLIDALQERPFVLSLGGGTLTVEETRERLRQKKAASGLAMIYLTARVSTIRERLEVAGARPMLGVAVPQERRLARWEHLFHERAPGYRALADMTVAVDDRRPEEIVARIALACGWSAVR